MKVYKGTWRIAPLILILGTPWSTLSPGSLTMPFLSRLFNKVSTRRPGIDPSPIHVSTYWPMNSLNIISHTTAVYAHKAIWHTMSHELYSVLVLQETIRRILLYMSKTALQLSTLTSPKWLTQYSSGDPSQVKVLTEGAETCASRRPPVC